MRCVQSIKTKASYILMCPGEKDSEHRSPLGTGNHRRVWSVYLGTGGRCQQGRCCLKTEIRFDFSKAVTTSNPNRREFLRALDILCKYQDCKNFLKTIFMNTIMSWCNLPEQPTWAINWGFDRQTSRGSWHLAVAMSLGFWRQTSTERLSLDL